jgi:hypothetical protein
MMILLLLFLGSALPPIGNTLVLLMRHSRPASEVSAGRADRLMDF